MDIASIELRGPRDFEDSQRKAIIWPDDGKDHATGVYEKMKPYLVQIQAKVMVKVQLTSDEGCAPCRLLPAVSLKLHYLVLRGLELHYRELSSHDKLCRKRTRTISSLKIPSQIFRGQAM